MSFPSPIVMQFLNDPCLRYAKRRAQSMENQKRKKTIDKELNKDLSEKSISQWKAI